MNVLLKKSGFAQVLPRLIAALCIALGATVPAQSQTAVARTGSPAALPNLGDGTELTPTAERRLGDRIARELYRDPDYVDDPILQEYVDGIWQPLLAAARQRGDLPPELDESYAWAVLLGRDRSINAFALPGAYFGLHLGLVATVTSRDELASVLAHELSHVTQRHIARSMERQSQQAPWMIGAMILGVLAASKSGSADSAQAANAMIVGGQALGAQSQLNFSRDMEREADRMGFAVATQAGFAPEGFVSMFGKLAQGSRLNDVGNFPYLRSHPLSTERMADMQSRLELAPQEDAHSSARRNQPEWEQAMMAARARVMSQGSVDALRMALALGQEPALARASPVQRAGALYGACLAALKLREFAQAQTLWHQLQVQVRGDPAAARQARLLGVELAMAQGHVQQAAALLKGSVPGATEPARVEMLMAAQVATVARSQMAAQSELATEPARNLETTLQQLQTWVAAQPRDALAWQRLASAYEVQGRTLSAIRAQAEVHAAQMDYPAALARFRAAQEWTRKNPKAVDHFEASIVDTRARQVESRVREQALER